MLFCGATPVHRYVPYSDAIVSPCQGDGHYYCEDYLSLADPDRDRSESGRTERGVDPAQEAADVARDPEVRPWLFYAPNHLWLDRRDDATCIVGLDAFAARLLGRVDDVTFVVTRGVRRPSLTLSVRGVDLHLVFPNPLELTGINVAVREDPGRIVSDPYLRGWLFRGRDAAPAPAGSGSRATLGLRTGKEAVEWMQAEWEEAARRFHDWLALREPMETRVLADGGVPAIAPAALLGRQDLLVLVGRFFLSGAGRES
jgi:glycine cleavage system H lipoate-binding protein